MTTPRHFLEIDDLSAAELAEVLSLSDWDRDAPPAPVLAGRSVALYFEKPSLRTRHSCEAAVTRLGGHPVTFTDSEAGLGSREPVSDVAKVLSGFHSAVGARVFDQQLVVDLAADSTVPVINLLSDTAHPCQALGDLLTMQQEFGSLKGRTLCWVGDFNNVARSLSIGAAMCGMRVQIASPTGYGPSEADIDRLIANGVSGTPVVTRHPSEAAHGADAVHTDVWASMGQEREADIRRKVFAEMQVDDSVMAAAHEDAIFMHCLPARRGEEVSAEVADGPRSRMIAQAHNRMYAMIGLFRWLAAQER